ncbi:retrovirus-related pol polyprotein from transposon TNT 1-94 [Tanacetum coccineum]
MNDAGQPTNDTDTTHSKILSDFALRMKNLEALPMSQRGMSNPTSWEESYIHEVIDTGVKTFAAAVVTEKTNPKVNFRSLFNEDKVEDIDFVLPIENVMAAQHRFNNSLVGFFVGKGVAFPLVKNYVTNTWGKFGLQKVMRDDDGVFFFKFTSLTGLEQVLEKGPWMIQNQPLILTKWKLNLIVSKDEVTTVPVWVKIHKVPVVAYSADGLSLIGS